MVIASNRLIDLDEASRIIIHSGHDFGGGRTAGYPPRPGWNKCLEWTSATKLEQRCRNVVPREGAIWLQRALLDRTYELAPWHGAYRHPVVDPQSEYLFLSTRVAVIDSIILSAGLRLDQSGSTLSCCLSFTRYGLTADLMSSQGSPCRSILRGCPSVSTRRSPVASLLAWYLSCG